MDPWTQPLYACDGEYSKNTEDDIVIQDKELMLDRERAQTTEDATQDFVIRSDPKLWSGLNGKVDIPP